MIYEIARVEIKVGHTEMFEADIAKAIPIFKRAQGSQQMWLEKSIEEPRYYRIIVQWNRLEDHTIGFRESEDYVIWRDLVGDHFASPPVVEHTHVVINGF